MTVSPAFGLLLTVTVPVEAVLPAVSTNAFPLFVIVAVWPTVGNPVYVPVLLAATGALAVNKTPPIVMVDVPLMVDEDGVPIVKI